MSSFFCFQRQAYRDTVVKVTFHKKLNQESKETALKALNAQRELEKRLIGKKSQTQTQRNDLNVKGSSLAVARKLNTAVSQAAGTSLIYGDNINLEEIVFTQDKDGITRTHFEAIYLANEETLAAKFKHITTDDLNRIKKDLIVKLERFKTVLDRGEFHNRLETAGKLDDCRWIIQQTIDLISCAKSLSAVIATIAIEADLLAQLGVAEDLSTGEGLQDNLVRGAKNLADGAKGLLSIFSQKDKNESNKDKEEIVITATNSAADLFADDLPNQLRESLEDRRTSLGLEINAVGSAFQLEDAREKLITRLEAYLAKRAELINTEKNDSVVIYNYRPIDRGIFYNKALQEARIEIAANFLAELKHMQLNDESRNYQSITNPQLFAQAFIRAFEKNIDVYNNLARKLPGGIPIDDIGELAVMLDEMRMEMKNIYPKDVKLSHGGISMYQQLGLNEPTQQLQNV
ncbi:hypothetical protein [Legionella hackeliae]|nr:hypothetical protein [Legionella hackeliae]